MSTSESKTDILSFSIPEKLSQELEAVMTKVGYQNRSELIRDAIRLFLEKQAKLAEMEGEVEGITIISYPHEAEREVHDRFHETESVFRSFLHLDFENPERCCDVVVFKGEGMKVQEAINRIQKTKRVQSVSTILP